jgi:nitrogen fixation-related uncharacterized protein
MTALLIGVAVVLVVIFGAQWWSMRDNRPNG